MKYIDVDKLKNEIEQRRSNIKAYCLQPNHDKRFDVVSEQIAHILSIIDSLQQEQPKVVLDNVIEEYFNGWTETDEGIACHYQYVDLNTCRSIAHHFYELGLNARKEE